MKNEVAASHILNLFSQNQLTKDQVGRLTEIVADELTKGYGEDIDVFDNLFKITAVEGNWKPWSRWRRK